MNEAALAIFRKGHVPIIGVNMALPVIAAPAAMRPAKRKLAERCDAFLPIGGDSVGAEQEMARFVAAGKRVFHSLEEITKNAPSPLVGEGRDGG